MKWSNDLPDDWSTAPEDPPTGRDEDLRLHAEELVNGVIVREPGSTEAYIYASDGGVVLEDGIEDRA